MPRVLTLIGAVAVLAILAGADENDLVISEVLEGNSSLKYVEIHNQGATPVDLESGGADIVLRRYSNAGTTVSATIDLTGTVVAGGFYVVANNMTDFNTNTFGFDADQYTGSLSHNGNDKWDLFDSTGLAVLDGFATDNVGDATSFATDIVAFRIGSALPNNGDWGDTNEPAAGANSASGFWVVETTNSFATAAAEGTPGASGGSGGDEVPIKLQSFSVE